MDKEDVNERERKRAMKIIIDADACPVQDVVIEESAKRGKDVILVKSYAHYSNVEQEAEVIYVDPGNDSADYKIVQLAVPGDIIITQDYGLAALALEKNCKVLHHTGFLYSKDRIDAMLFERHQSAKRRRSKQRVRGPKPFTNEQKEHFKEQFIKELEA